MRPSGVVLALGLSACGPPCAEGLLCTLAGTGDLGFNGDGLPALETRLASPTSVTVDPEGRPVVVDYSNMRVRVLTDDGLLVTIAGNGIHAYSEPGLAPTDSPLENPIDAAWGPDGRLYVLPQHEGRVIRVGDDGLLERAVGTGELADGDDGLPALDVTMGFGGGLAFHPDGPLFVSDNTFSRIRRADLDGTVETAVGTGSGEYGEPSLGPDTAIRSPERVVVDASRNRLVVADAENHRILAVDLDTLDVSVLAGTGASGYAGDDGPATSAQLHNPTGLALTDDGGVVVSDQWNHALRLVTADGTIHTVAGGTEGEPRRRAAPEDFPMTFPAGLAWTPEGDLLIAEQGGHRVLRWTGAADAL